MRRLQEAESREGMRSVCVWMPDEMHRARAGAGGGWHRDKRGGAPRGQGVARETWAQGRQAVTEANDVKGAKPGRAEKRKGYGQGRVFERGGWWYIAYWHRGGSTSRLRT